MKDGGGSLVSLEVDHPIWERTFLVSPLVVVGTREGSGEYDLAPKHMVVPLGWDNYFGFVCAPTHSTYSNVKREKAFTVSFPTSSQIVATSLAASPRCDDGSKLVVQALPTIEAQLIDGIFLKDSYLYLECELDRIVEDFGRNCLIAGKIVAAHVEERSLRRDDKDDQEVLKENPLLVYLHPGRFALAGDSDGFPLPSGFRR